MGITNQDLRFRQVSTLIVKVTHRCNLDCLYCYEYITKKGDDMPLETFRGLVDRVLTNSEQKEILFLFHGGEPTLLPNQWYESAIQYAQNQAFKLQKKVKFSMQTNLLGINEHKIELFKKYQIHLGVSLDGTENFVDSMRGGENRVFTNYLKIKQLGVKAGILTTINHCNYDKFTEICHFLVNQAQVSDFKANVVTSVGRGYGLPSLSAEQIFRAQHAILEFMIATKGTQLLETNLCTEIQRFFATEAQRATMPRTLCQEKRCGAGETVLGVSPQGNLLPCGRFQWNDEDYFLGNLSESQAFDYQSFKQKTEAFHDLVPQSWYDCHTCEARQVCGFGCQAFIVRSREQANVDCLPTKMRFQYFKENKNRLLPVYEAILAKQSPRQTSLGFQIKDKNGQAKTYQLETRPKPPNQTKKAWWNIF
ncbi:MAG: radical SAM protein [Microscillaceae bacterium]|jgi:uncharacterized protein|nr:radical SAM protein [Microscillaceae bacterium]